MLQEGYTGQGVVTGCAATADGTDLVISVAAGTIAVAGIGIGGTTSGQIDTGSGTTTLSAADATNPRFDIVYITTGGSISHATGTASSNPIFPSLSAGQIALAAVYVGPTVTAIQSADVIDKRVFVPSPVAPLYQMAVNFR